MGEKIQSKIVFQLFFFISSLFSCIIPSLNVNQLASPLSSPVALSISGFLLVAETVTTLYDNLLFFLKLGPNR